MNLSSVQWWAVGIQLIGFIAMGLGIGSYQAKHRTTILIIQSTAGVLWGLQFFLLASPAGLINNVIALARNVLYAQKEKHAWARSLLLPACFILLVIAAGCYTFTKEGAVGLLPTVAMLIQTVAYYITNERIIRILALFVSPLWLIYDALAGSSAGVLCEALTMISIVIALFRYHGQGKKAA